MLICGDAGIGRQASLRCLCQYWRVGSSPISRTSVKDIRFSSVLYFYISANQQSIIIEKSHTGIARNLWFCGSGTCSAVRQGKHQVPQSVLACGFKSHFPHQCKGHSIFGCPFFISRQISKSAKHYHRKNPHWNRTKSLILWKRNLFRSTKSLIWW